jgi:hypothetical protein
VILLPRTRDAAKLKGFTGKALQDKLGKLLGFHYDEGDALSFAAKARQIWGPAKAQLKEESFGKCAYCEADTSVVAHGDVEHFRPKSAYWWLAYCYDNYTYSCQICNQIYKGDQFPRAGAKLAAPVLPAARPTQAALFAQAAAALCLDPSSAQDARLKALFDAEDADLPHPYLNDPEKLFGWKENRDTKEVKLVARGRSAQARRAVKAAETVLGLNRSELLRVRWLAFQEIETLALLLQEAGLPPAAEQRILAQLRASAAGERPFAGMKRFFLRKWGVL